MYVFKAAYLPHQMTYDLIIVIQQNKRIYLRKKDHFKFRLDAIKVNCTYNSNQNIFFQIQRMPKGGSQLSPDSA